jgi:hypothetical protein
MIKTGIWSTSLKFTFPQDETDKHSQLQNMLRRGRSGISSDWYHSEDQQVRPHWEWHLCRDQKKIRDWALRTPEERCRQREQLAYPLEERKRLMWSDHSWESCIGGRCQRYSRSPCHLRVYGILRTLLWIRWGVARRHQGEESHFLKWSVWYLC